jgi:AAA domain
MPTLVDLNDPAARATALEREKHVLRIKNEAKHAVSLERQFPIPDILALTLPELASYRFPARRALLSRGNAVVFREGHIGQAFALRGVGKTFFMQTLALVAATGIEALGFCNPDPCRVLYVYGEDASEEIQERMANLCRILRVPEATFTDSGSLTMIAADWQTDYLPRLDTLEGQAAIEPFVEANDFIFLDNRSCLFDSESEKDASAWQPAQDWLLSLRRRGKAVMLAHHTNRQGGARGISKAEDPMNLLLKLTRPEDYIQSQGARFKVEFDKARGVYGAAAAPFIAALTPNGWRVEPAERSEEDNTTRKLLEYLKVAHEADERPKSANDAISKARVNRNKGLEVWAAMIKAGTVVKHPYGGFQVVGEL